jgi:DNA-binding CsgD family transcriptional regulator
MADRAPDLSPLNEAERTVLRLLAQGHTAKSIAAATGRSEASVNERLREARRKTGMGSSRELARVFAAQENRDEQIGMAAGSGASAATAREAAAPVAGGISKGFAAMVVLVAVGAAAAIALLQPRVSQDAAAADPMIGELVGKHEQMPPRLYAKLRAETRDAGWAPQAEAALRARYDTVPGVSKDLRVICGATLCEVAGTIDPGAKGDFAAMQALQDAPIERDLQRQGFKERSAAGFGGDDGRGRMRFFTYWTRAAR